MLLRLLETYRYPQHGQRDPSIEMIDGAQNFFWATYVDDGRGQAQLESGINVMKEVGKGDASRRPAVLISTSPSKAGSKTTPWHDVYDMDSGRIRYFGDAKPIHMPDPGSPKGNKALLKEFMLHRGLTRGDRLAAAPLFFFVTTKSGFKEFRGVGLIENIDLVSQVDPSSGAAFSNYVYDCCVVSLAEQGETINWEWIKARRNSELSLDETLQFAPTSWKRFVDEGIEAIPRIRRVVAKNGISSKAKQLPAAGSEEDLILHQIYNFYSAVGTGRKKRFEALAEVVAEFVISELGTRYQPGWVTRGSGDGGVDFVGRIDIGSGISRTSLVVLGQAKCEKPESATSGRDIARTVARLRRGWVGCYVTTSTFSDATQREVSEDKYPIILINGKEVARAIRTISIRDGATIEDLLQRIDDGYESRIRDRDPEQIFSI